MQQSIKNEHPTHYKIKKSLTGQEKWAQKFFSLEQIAIFAE